MLATHRHFAQAFRTQLFGEWTPLWRTGIDVCRCYTRVHCFGLGQQFLFVWGVFWWGRWHCWWCWRWIASRMISILIVETNQLRSHWLLLLSQVFNNHFQLGNVANHVLQHWLQCCVRTRLGMFINICTRTSPNTKNILYTNRIFVLNINQNYQKITFAGQGTIVRLQSFSKCFDIFWGSTRSSQDSHFTGLLKEWFFLKNFFFSKLFIILVLPRFQMLW